MRQQNIDTFRKKLHETDWSVVLNDCNGPNSFQTFYDKFTVLYDKSFPMKPTTTTYRNRKPWLSEGIKKSIKIKNRLYTIQAKRPTTENVRQYKKYKCDINRLMRIAERKHYNDLLQENQRNTRKLWGIIKEVINKKKQRICPSQFKFGDKMEENKEIIANKFNNYFSNIGKDLAKQIPTSNTDPLSYVLQSNPNSIFIESVLENEVEKILHNLKNASAGYDSIHSKVVKATYKEYLAPLTHVLNLSITQGFFPNPMKIAKVIPLYKASDPTLISNYRPVSVLPLFSKVLERLMYNRLISFINRNKILYNYQFGFRAGHSTNMALTVLVDKILSAIDQGDFMIGVFLDFKKSL
jgi:hypothetical protein